MARTDLVGDGAEEEKDEAEDDDAREGGGGDNLTVPHGRCVCMPRVQ